MSPFDGDKRKDWSHGSFPSFPPKPREKDGAPGQHGVTPAYLSQDSCHENGAPLHNKSMTYEPALFSCHVVHRRCMMPVVRSPLHK